MGLREMRTKEFDKMAGKPFCMSEANPKGESHGWDE